MAAPQKHDRTRQSHAHAQQVTETAQAARRIQVGIDATDEQAEEKNSKAPQTGARI